jgi:hypothetical protein
LKPCIRLLVFLFVCIIAVSITNLGAASEPNIVNNPHTGKGDCSICHVASVNELRSWFVFGSTKRRLTKDRIALCQQCHGISFGHGIGKKPVMNRASLPLNADGTVNCAVTCHDMHINESEDAAQLRMHLRLPHVKLCFSCHDK